MLPVHTVDPRNTAEDEELRRELGSWLAGAVPAHGSSPGANDWPARRAWETGWQRKLHDAGWAGIAWPREYGGRGESLTRQLVYYEEIARARAPKLGVNFVGLQHAGPTLFTVGTAAQKARHLGPILRGDEVFCSGFSEPGAGSDLAGLTTRAVRDGDTWVITGRKIWCSYAHVADFCQVLARTDPAAPKHAGLSCFILPMRLPGIDARPLRTALGDSEFCEVFLDEVRVPAENLVGELNDGWRVANVTLRFERGTSFAGAIFELRQLLAELAAIARRTTRDEARAWDDAALRREVGALVAEVDGLEALLKLVVSEAERTGVPGLASSTIKLAYSELYQRVTDLGLRLLGRAVLSRSDFDGLPNDDLMVKTWHSLSLTISAGTSQIQRNIIAERILGLPRER